LLQVSHLYGLSQFWIIKDVISILLSNMGRKDPFDKVLQKLCLYQEIENMNPIHTAAMPAAQSLTYEVPCRTRGDLLPITPDTPDGVLGELALHFIKFIHPIGGTSTTQIRPISLILNLDGTVQAEPVQMGLADDHHAVYPPRYCIPMSTISNLPLEEQVWRAEKFALGTLLYELFAGHTIFEGMSNDEVQDRYGKGATFPDLTELPALIQCLIYACWSAEFGRHITLNKFGQYVKNNPWRFALQVTGGVVTTAALITVPILGAVGFSAIGPVAGSAAAGWQAAIGAVEAGSLFAFCQSVTMGGAAVATLTGAGVGGAAAAAAASALPGGSNPRETFVWKFREAP
jgi:hypothetical protein